MQGCSLPEETRLAYLDAMEISAWQRQHVEPEAESETETGTGPVAATQQAERPEGWEPLQQAVADCVSCSQLCQHRTQTVFGVGDRNADVLVIGEAPGRDEDLKGEPFVGAAGQLLTAMLKAIDLEREDVYIANILKCRPPNNRDPSSEEAKNCRAFLDRQVELIQPRAIFVVGRIAAQNLLDTDAAIGKLRGSEHSYRGIPVLVSYHPAYLLRQPDEKRKSWEDLKRLRRMMDTWQ